MFHNRGKMWKHMHRGPFIHILCTTTDECNHVVSLGGKGNQSVIEPGVLEALTNQGLVTNDVVSMATHRGKTTLWRYDWG